MGETIVIYSSCFVGQQIDSKFVHAKDEIWVHPLNKQKGAEISYILAY